MGSETIYVIIGCHFLQAGSLLKFSQRHINKHDLCNFETISTEPSERIKDQHSTYLKGGQRERFPTPLFLVSSETEKKTDEDQCRNEGKIL